MKKGDYLKIILKEKQTVFSFREILFLWNEKDTKAAISRINYYIKNRQLIRLRRGLYAKSIDYNRYEVANKIYIPSYISFETVLQNEGMVFQGYTSIYVASYKTKDIVVNGQKYCFRTIRNVTLTNHRGLYQKEGIWIASAERAFLDILYLHKDYYFDNLSVLDWEKVNDLMFIYGNNKRMLRIVKELEKIDKEQY
jgi:hypothetical protein